MMDNKTCRVDILSVSLGDEGYLIIPRETRELCEPLVKTADALERALGDLPVDEAGKNRIARLSAELMAQAERREVQKCCGGKLLSAGYACSAVSERSAERDPI